MSKMFSVVTLSSDYGMWVEYFAAGCPDCADDLLDDTVIRDDLASQPKDSTICVEVETYLYGEGETIRASEEDLADLSRRFDELREGSQLDRIGAHSFSFPFLWILFLSILPKIRSRRNGRMRTIWNYKLRQGKRG